MNKVLEWGQGPFLRIEDKTIDNPVEGKGGVKIRATDRAITEISKENDLITTLNIKDIKTLEELGAKIEAGTATEKEIKKFEKRVVDITKTILHETVHQGEGIKGTNKKTGDVKFVTKNCVECGDEFEKDAKFDFKKTSETILKSLKKGGSLSKPDSSQKKEGEK